MSMHRVAQDTCQLLRSGPGDPRAALGIFAAAAAEGGAQKAKPGQ